MTTDITTTEETFAIPGVITATGLTLPEDLPFERWLAVGETLKRIEKSVGFWIGDWLRFGERKYGQMYTQALEATGLEYGTLRQYKWVAEKVELSNRLDNLGFAHHMQVAPLEPGLQSELLARAQEEGMSVRELRQEVYHVRQALAIEESPPMPDGLFRCIVIDPPWPVEKIEREVRPNQRRALDYPTMSLAEIMDLPVPDRADPAGCHVYLWTTHKFMPYAFHLFTHWGVNYECTLTWLKPVGMTPYSWMYNTEHALFGRIGPAKLLKLGLKLGFEGPVLRHSEKPEAFYERVAEASPGPRLEMFARKVRPGFIAWGNEVPEDVPA